MSALSYSEQSLINNLSERVRTLEALIAEMKADINTVGNLSADLALIAHAKGGPLDKQVEQIIVSKGQKQNGN